MNVFIHHLCCLQGLVQVRCGYVFLLPSDNSVHSIIQLDNHPSLEIFVGWQ
jgi:hypothetical protein